MSYELQTFGIYPDTIEENIRLAQAVESDFDEIMMDYSYDYTTIDVTADAAEDFKNHIETKDITNAIISSTFGALESWVNQYQLGSGNHCVIMRINSYVNGDDSHLYVTTNGGRSYTELFTEGDLREAFNNELATVICDAVTKNLDIKKNELCYEDLVDDISDGIKNGEFDRDDIKMFLSEGILEGSLKEIQETTKAYLRSDKSKDDRDI